jgi:Phage Tail Collar Domain
MLARRQVLIGLTAAPAVVKIRTLMPAVLKTPAVPSPIWLRCEGQAVSKKQFKELFKILQHAYDNTLAKTDLFRLPQYDCDGTCYVRATHDELQVRNDGRSLAGIGNYFPIIPLPTDSNLSRGLRLSKIKLRGEDTVTDRVELPIMILRKYKWIDPV